MTVLEFGGLNVSIALGASRVKCKTFLPLALVSHKTLKPGVDGIHSYHPGSGFKQELFKLWGRTPRRCESVRIAVVPTFSVDEKPSQSLSHKKLLRRFSS